MTPNRIIFELAEKEKSQSDVARELGITPEGVNQIVHKVYNSRKVQDYIRGIIGGSHEEIWINDPYVKKEKK